MNGWLLRSLVEDLTDEELREHTAWCARLLADRRRRDAASADEIAQRKTDPGPSFDDPIEVKADGRIRAEVRPGVIPPPEWDDQ